MKFDDAENFYSMKVEILKNNIFGADLDPKAVEIAQLNLLLQISERKHRLPLLQNNIKIGNSLIDDPSVSDKAFKWEEEFPEIMNNGGFDVVIGNPPYVRIQNLGEEEIIHFNNTFKSAFKNYDIYLLFVEKSLKLLSKNGDIGFIIPSKFVNSDYGLGLRNLISETKTLHKFVDFKDIQIFGDATNYTCLLFLRNSENREFAYLYPKSKDNFSLQEVSNKEMFHEYSLPNPLKNEPWVLADNNISKLIEKLKNQGNCLGEICKNIFQGLVTGADGIYFVKIINETKQMAIVRNIRDGNEFEMEKSILKKLLKGKDIRKWSVKWADYYVIYPYKVEKGKAWLIPISEIEAEYPLTYKYFKHYEGELKSRENNRFKTEDNWHQFGRLQNIEKFEQTKIMTQVLASHNTFAFDDISEYYFVGGGNAGGYGIVLKDEYKESYYYILALLNSNVLEFYLKNISTPFRGGYFSYGKRFIEKLPIIFSKGSESNSIATLSEKQVDISARVSNLQNTDERERLERQLNDLELELNKIIYKVYGLNNWEIGFLEGKL